MNKLFNVAVVGATGLVGRTMVRVLEERNFPVEKLFLYSSEKSAGEKINYKNKEITVQKLDEESFKNVDIALFSAGKDVSIKFAPIAVKNNCIVIDNGSYWRMHKDVPLIVPEVNPESASEHHGIIANPNCSTIQLVVALNPIQRVFGLKRIVISTYQSISGAGQKGVNKLFKELEDPLAPVDYKHKFAFNTVFHEFTDDSGFSVEETKMKDETRKIFGLPDLKIAVTCVRLPIFGGHGESVNFETLNKFSIPELKETLSEQAGTEILDDPLNEIYPTPIIADDTDLVYIGRIRKDDSVENGGYLWIVSDNRRKGAATNAVQIAELLIKKETLSFKAFEF